MSATEQRPTYPSTRTCAKSHGSQRTEPYAHMTLTLRSPRIVDFETVASWISDARACSRWAGPQLRFPFSAAELTKLINATATNSFCLSPENGDLVGFAQYFDKGNGVVRLSRVIVSPSHRGRGFGKLLCELLMQEALKCIKVESFSLGVYRDNPAAIATYSKLGFSPVEEDSTAERLSMKLWANPTHLDSPQG